MTLNHYITQDMISVEVLHSGISISKTVGADTIKKLYVGYSKTAALKEFRREIKTHKTKR